MASIELSGVTVIFPIFDGGSRSLKRRLVSATTGGRIASDGGNNLSIHALDGITMSVAHGDRIGLIGHNGAGKTTLLRVMAGIYEPVAGTATVAGKVAPLFDINLGMDPDLSGYENIQLRGMFLGLGRAQVQARMEEIAAFTELGSYLDMPLRTYSAGMRARLAFAVSTSIEPEILLLDEGIGAGDAAFLEKASARIDEFVRSAGIFVLASHSESFVRETCNKAVLLDHGRIAFAGPVEEAIARYHGHA
jgi:ABC-type polysaccharide/polyol phosphate transport system ATPase subunit